MKALLSHLPYPIAGVCLAMAALGNLLMPFSQTLRLILGVLSAAIILMLIVRIIVERQSFITAFNLPAVAGVLATIPMSITLLSSYALAFSKSLALAIWWLGVISHFALIFMFAAKYFRNFSIKNVFPAWFVMCVGVVTSTVTAPLHGVGAIGIAIFWFGLISYFILLPLIVYRLVKWGPLPAPARPTLAIFAAPASLLLAGHHAVFDQRSLLYWLIVVASVAMYLIVLAMLPRLIGRPFMVSFSAFTFPLVISAVALRPLLIRYHQAMLGNAMVLLALLAVSYVFAGYLCYVFSGGCSTAPAA